MELYQMNKDTSWEIAKKLNLRIHIKGSKAYWKTIAELKYLKYYYWNSRKGTLLHSNFFDKLSLYSSQVAYPVGAYSGFPSMKGQGVALLFPGWVARPLQGYPPLPLVFHQAFLLNCWYAFILLAWEALLVSKW